MLLGLVSITFLESVWVGDIRHSTPDPSKLMAAGWNPRFDVASGLEQALRGTQQPAARGAWSPQTGILNRASGEIPYNTSQ